MISRKQGGITSRTRASMVVALSFGFTTMVQAACLPPQNQLPQNQIQSFLNDPKGLLSGSPFGGTDMSTLVGKLVASDPAALPVVIQLLSSANPQQRYSIGAGLSEAAHTCLSTDQAFAALIQSELAASGDRVAMTAFVSTGGQDTATAATGANGPAATAFTSGFAQVTGTSQNTNNTNPIFQGGTITVGGNPFSFSPGTPGTTRSNTVINPVSP
jgi:hypothetical protein